MSAARTAWERAEAKPAPRESWAGARRLPFWLDSPLRPGARPALATDERCDLAIVGGGLTGLWAAVLAKQRDPSADVVVLEGDRIAAGASGRNGGFIESSLTHGVENGLARFPDEIDRLERLGHQNLAEIRALIEKQGIECGLELNGVLETAVEPHELDWLAERAALAGRFGYEAAVLDRAAIRGELDSPLFLGGIRIGAGAGLVDPARLSWGLAELAEELGVRIHEQTPVGRVSPVGSGLELACPGAALRAGRALLATSASRGLVAAIRRRIVPVYDYVLVSEPLSASQLERIGWHGRAGVTDLGNRFHYYRLTADDRILFGGYDAIYRYGSATGAELEQSDASSSRLAAHFFAVFPGLEGIRFTHRWGGAIDTCSRFFAFYGTAHDDRLAYAVGHTGLGVGASRFAARVGLELLSGATAELGDLGVVRRRPTPFPPEPLRWLAIELTRNRLASADRRGGERGLWLRTLDRLGLGFDS